MYLRNSLPRLVPTVYRVRSTARKLSNAPQNLHKMIENVKHLLKPPVGNTMIYGDGLLKVMIVGGPNQREDYHIEEGEELFYQIKGAMDLKIVENNEHKTVHIPEGSMFILPGRIPHSPQRYENTIGLLIERDRKASEFDGLKWYVPGTNRVLYEEYFPCKDLATQLAPIITRFFNSEAYRTKQPAPGMPIPNPPISADQHTFTDVPIDWNTISAPTANLTPCVETVLATKEFSVNLLRGAYHGLIKSRATEYFLWQLHGSSEVVCSPSESKPMKKGDIHLHTTMEGLMVKQGADGTLVYITNNVVL